MQLALPALRVNNITGTVHPYEHPSSICSYMMAGSTHLFFCGGETFLNDGERILRDLVIEAKGGFSLSTSNERHFSLDLPEADLILLSLTETGTA